MAHVQESIATTENEHRIHWRVPTLMSAYLLAGIGLVLGHHFFYTSLNSKVVSSSISQTWNLRIGTGLAFLVKVVLTGAVGTACVQNVWSLLRQKAVKVTTIDSWFGVLSNSWKLLDLVAWTQGPLVLCLALLCWLIPFSAIITPATLTVEPAPDMASTSQLVKIPLINWTYPMFETQGAGFYYRTTADMQRIATTVAYSGAMLSIPAPAPNASYALQFYGPTLKCIPANSSVTDAFNKTWAFRTQPYISMVPSSANFTTDLEKFHNSSLSSSSSTLRYLDLYSGDMARLYIATKNETINGTWNPPAINDCGLYNASYDALFEFNNGQQSIKIRNLTDLRPFQYWNYQNENSIYSPWNENYMSIFEAFGRIVVGSLSWSVSLEINMNTEALNTALINSFEMRSILATVKATGSGDTTFLNSEIANLGGGRNFTMAEAAEELFQNLTLSLYGTSTYRDFENATAPTNLTIFSPQNIYVYQPRNLALAYGLAVGFSILGVLAGFVAVVANGASYAFDFSSILRVTRNPELTNAVQADVTNGAEPLPSHLAKTKMRVLPISV
ncbi:hypothetical protein P152DRAFT_403231 [Eremomyces bilateralis CBS 781.70]|uniref:Uncharacterized protein n=1 Tax=Eremomyces bilateralis CBS 781.70 TaxID=1392243 RepID=A0A6G1FV10_9PEZI|nr:uncharacterized protein P152DRAFT_403231 [Eremomyces bilateralis CBS 781.70]KAF1809491.1 hypothetical protein P152DRAFT_403231 [Eremomyces bilateralis CBS 781.70]